MLRYMFTRGRRYLLNFINICVWPCLFFTCMCFCAEGSTMERFAYSTPPSAQAHLIGISAWGPPQEGGHCGTLGYCGGLGRGGWGAAIPAAPGPT